MLKKIFLFLFLLLNLKLFPSIHQDEYFLNLKSAYFGSPTNLSEKLVDKKEKGLHYNYYGYLPYWIDTLYYSNFQYELLTHISYFSVNVNTDGSCGLIPNPSYFTKIYNESHKRGIRIHLTFTLFGTTSVSTLLNSKSSRENCISNILNYVDLYNLDGVNLDFEFVSSSVRDSFNLFVNQLSDSLHNLFSTRKELYIAVPPVYQWYPGYDYNYLSTLSDGLFVMCYDYHWSGSSEAGPVSPTINSTFWGYYAFNTSLMDLIGIGVDPAKLIGGIPYYGYDWPTDSDTLKSTTLGNGTSVIFKNAKNNASLYGRKFDNYSKVPYYTYFSTNYHQTFYDDSTSIRLKLNTVKEDSLQGAGCWALGYDDGTTDIWAVIRDQFFISAPSNHFIVKVNTSALNIRSGPSTDYDILNVALYGDQFVSFDYDGYWYKIYYPSASFPYYAYLYGGDGVNIKYLCGENFKKVAKVTASLLNVRSGPSTSYSILTQIAKEQVFVVDSFIGDWAKIILPDSNRYGFIYYNTYTQIIDDLSSLNESKIFIDSLIHADTVFAGDSFEVQLFFKNIGFVSLDSLFVMKFLKNSVFYFENHWFDSTSSISYGHNSLPGQNGKRTFYFKAPDLLKDSLFSYEIFFSRNGDVSTDTIYLDIFVKTKSSGRNENDQPGQRKNEKIKFEKFFSVYDISGRLVKKSYGDFIDFSNLELPNGIYLIVSFDGKNFNRKKILKLR